MPAARAGRAEQDVRERSHRRSAAARRCDERPVRAGRCARCRRVGRGCRVPSLARRRAVRQLLVGRLAIDGLLVVPFSTEPLITAARSASVIGPMRDAGGRIHARSTIVGVPFSSRNETSASPTPSSRDRFLGIERRIRAQRRRRGLDGFLIARRERAQRVLHAVAELAEHRSRARRAGSASRSTRRRPSIGSAARPARSSATSAAGASVKSRCASSKKKTSFGLSGSPTSGRCSNSSDSIHSRNVA